MATHPTISQGSSGADVKLAQKRLVGRFYTPLAQDGAFGGQTKMRVKQYQTDRHNESVQPLAIDGIIGPKTWARLDPPTIQQGASGDPVKLLQHVLGHFGFTVAVDGSFGPLTKQAVIDFQTWWNATVSPTPPLLVDGIAGPLTWTALWS